MAPSYKERLASVENLVSTQKTVLEQLKREKELAGESVRAIFSGTKCLVDKMKSWKTLQTSEAIDAVNLPDLEKVNPSNFPFMADQTLQVLTCLIKCMSLWESEMLLADHTLGKINCDVTRIWEPAVVEVPSPLIRSLQLLEAATQNSERIESRTRDSISQETISEAEAILESLRDSVPGSTSNSSTPDPVRAGEVQTESTSNTEVTEAEDAQETSTQRPPVLKNHSASLKQPIAPNRQTQSTHSTSALPAADLKPPVLKKVTPTADNSKAKATSGRRR